MSRRADGNVLVQAGETFLTAEVVTGPVPFWGPGRWRLPSDCLAVRQTVHSTRREQDRQQHPERRDGETGAAPPAPALVIRTPEAKTLFLRKRRRRPGQEVHRYAHA